MRNRVTRRRLTGAAGLLLLAARAARGAEPAVPLTLAQVVELSGSGALSGDAWRSGVELAVQEINAAGGLLGRPLAVVTFDAQSSAAAARLAFQHALELDPLALLGPVLPEPARSALTVARPRGTAVILGGGAADLTGPAHPATFRPVPSAAALMARLGQWLHDAAKAPRLAVLWSGRDPYRTSRDALARAAREHGLAIAADWVTESTDTAADVARLLSALPDLLVVLLPDEQAGHAIVEARRQAPQLALLGEASLLSAPALAVAGATAEGVRAHVLLAPEPDGSPPAGFAARYPAADRQAPDDMALAGYLAVGMVRAAAAKSGSADPRVLADALRELAVTAAREPMLLADCAWNAAGDPDRASWIVEQRAGKRRSVQQLHDATAAGVAAHD